MIARFAALAVLTLAPTCAGGAEFMFRAVVGDEMLEGRPVTWSDATMVLLGRDGWIHEFHPRRARQAKKTAPIFRGYTHEEMRQRLYEEFGSRFEYSSTGHYLVAHPRGERSVWGQRFEDLYRSFVRYFRVRGFTPVEPPYPLVAVVFPNRSEYDRHLAKTGSSAPPTVRGHYELRSNRVYLYKQSSIGDDRWDETAETVIHEATHQTAYNVGVHTRFADGPRWLCEGLAMMFEARGVHDSRSYDRGDSRINWHRLMAFRKYEEGGSSGMGDLATYVSSDQPFDRTPLPAYARAWALTFFLSETRPREYAKYLTVTARRPTNSKYPPAERVADFRRVFGDNLTQLDAQFRSYLKGLGG